MTNVVASALEVTPPCQTLGRNEALRVPIILRLASPRRVRSIVATLHGAEETKATYVTTHTGPKGQVTTQVHTAVEHVDIIKQHWLLAGHERRGCIGNFADAVATMFGGGRHVRMTPGEATYEVELTIPPDAPATHTGKQTRVFYELTARVDIALGRDLKTSHAFSVAPLPHDEVAAQPIRVCYPDDEGRGLWSSLLEPDLRLELALDRDRAHRSETICGNLRLETDKPLNVRSASARLIGEEKSRAQGHRDSYRFEGEAVTIEAPRLIAPSWSTDFSLPVQIEAPPTTTGDLFSIDWFVEVTLDVPWAKDPTIRAPITLV